MFRPLLAHPYSRLLVVPTLVAISSSGLRAVAAEPAPPGRPIVVVVHTASQGRLQQRSFKQLLATLGDDVLQGDSLRQRIDLALAPTRTRLNVDAVVERAEQGRRLCIEGEYEQAIPLLEKVQRIVSRSAAEVAASQRLQDARYDALLRLIEAYRRTKQPDLARQRAEESLRSFPSRNPRRSRYSPVVTDFHRQVRRELDQQPKAQVSIVTEPGGYTVFVNERYAGVSPVRDLKLYGGTHRIFVQREKDSGRLNALTASAGSTARLVIDAAFEQALGDYPQVGLSFSNDIERRRHITAYLGRLGRAVRSNVAIVLQQRQQGSQPLLYVTVVRLDSGALLHGARLNLQPPPSKGAIAEFAAALLAVTNKTGRDGQQHITALADDLQAEAQTRPRGLAILKWTGVGATAAALAAGVTLVALDGLCTRHTEDTAAQQAAGGDRCLESFQGAVPGYTLLGVGGALAALTVYLFVRDHRRRSTMEQKSSAPPPGSALGKPYVWLGQGMVGVSTTATFH